jgi:hypothetical protein
MMNREMCVWEKGRWGGEEKVLQEKDSGRGGGQLLQWVGRRRGQRHGERRRPEASGTELLPILFPITDDSARARPADISAAAERERERRIFKR